MADRSYIKRINVQTDFSEWGWRGEKVNKALDELASSISSSAAEFVLSELSDSISIDLEPKSEQLDSPSVTVYFFDFEIEFAVSLSDLAAQYLTVFDSPQDQEERDAMADALERAAESIRSFNRK